MTPPVGITLQSGIRRSSVSGGLAVPTPTVHASCICCARSFGEVHLSSESVKLCGASVCRGIRLSSSCGACRTCFVTRTSFQHPRLSTPRQRLQCLPHQLQWWSTSLQCQRTVTPCLRIQWLQHHLQWSSTQLPRQRWVTQHRGCAVCNASPVRCTHADGDRNQLEKG